MKFLSTTLLITGLLLTANSYAEKNVKKARWYQVNLTLFQQKPDSGINEDFSFNKLKLEMADTLQLHTDAQFTLADSGMNALMALHHENSNGQAFLEQDINSDWTKIVNKLDPVNQPILHNVQWVQPIYDQQHSLPVYFESSVQALGQPILKGLIEINVARYLHSTISLQYIPKKAHQLDETISLQQTRRMRSKEIHYIDHPYVGAIIRIIPVKHPLEPTSNEKPKAELNSVLNNRL